MTMNGRLIMKTTMNKHVILLSAAVVLLFSCTRESDQVIQPGETITFTAAWAGSDETRTILQSDGTSVWWESGAQINVFFSDKASGRFTSTNTQSQAIVDFQGSLPIVVGSVETENPAHAYWAVYPYNAANTCDGESVTLTVPSTQTAVEGTFANKMFPSIATSTSFHLAFYNICGGVRFSVANEGISSITFKANNDESLVGTVQVGFDGVPVIQNVIEGNSEAVVIAPTGGFVPGRFYFAALLPQTLSKGVSLTFKKEDGKVASTSLDNSITINRSRFGKMEEKDINLEFKEDGSGHEPSDIIVFADEKVKTRLVARFDSNGDGELSYEEAASVTSIEGVLTIKTITSFDEFQFFTGVTSIPDAYFREWTHLTSIVLPPNLTSIGEYAFYNCESLISIDNIPKSVSFIGKYAFYGCSKMTSSISLDGLTEIGDYVFWGCSSLTTVVFHDCLEGIGQYAFYNCSSLASISLPISVLSIGKYAFRGCTSLSSIIIPEKVTTIEAYSFLGCSGLTTVAFHDKLNKIGDGAFSGCSSLISLIIPKSVYSIINNPFSSCSGLCSITVDSDNPYYDSRNNCNAIISTSSNILVTGCKNSVIPESVIGIGERAFVGCHELISIILPNSITSIGQSAFANCTNLSSIYIPESVFRIEASTFTKCEKLSFVHIPESITSIGNNAFSYCSSLKEVIIPESVTTMDHSVFSYCSSLESVSIPESLSTISNHTFNYCTSLTSISLPNSITTIGSAAFQNCSSLLNAVIPKSVNSIGSYAFYNCSKLTSITIKASTPPSGGSEMFHKTNDCPIYVPAESVSAYKSASGWWPQYNNRIQAIPE